MQEWSLLGPAAKLHSAAELPAVGCVSGRRSYSKRLHFFCHPLLTLGLFIDRDVLRAIVVLLQPLYYLFDASNSKVPKTLISGTIGKSKKKRK